MDREIGKLLCPLQIVTTERRHHGLNLEEPELSQLGERLIVLNPAHVIILLHREIAQLGGQGGESPRRTDRSFSRDRDTDPLRIQMLQGLREIVRPGVQQHATKFTYLLWCEAL